MCIQHCGSKEGFLRDQYLPALNWGADKCAQLDSCLVNENGERVEQLPVIEPENLQTSKGARDYNLLKKNLANLSNQNSACTDPRNHSPSRVLQNLIQADC